MKFLSLFLDPDLCPSYPEKLVVLLCTPDVDLLRGGSIYEEGRFPTASWMNQSNGSVLLRAAATTAERYCFEILFFFALVSELSFYAFGEIRNMCMCVCVCVCIFYENREWEGIFHVFH